MEKIKQQSTKDRKKILSIVIGAIAGVLVVLGIALAFLLNYNVYAPNQVQVLKDSKTYFSVNSNNNYKGYRFKFVSSAGEIIVDSDSNIIILEEDVNGLVPGNVYQISACYLGETEGANSDFSQPISWTYYERLDSPLISYDNSSNIISWDKVENADYYVLWISEEVETSSFKLTENSFDLNNLDGGEKSFYVYAYSNEPYFEQSKISNVIETTFIKYFQPITNAKYDLETKILTFTTTQEITNIDVKANISWLYDKTVNGEKLGDKFQYSVYLDNLSISSETDLQIRPTSIDQYNQYIGEPTQVEIV